VGRCKPFSFSAAQEEFVNPVLVRIRAGRVEYEPFELAGISFKDPVILY